MLNFFTHGKKCMSKLFDLIKTGVIDVSVSPGKSFVKYTEQDLKWGY